MPKHMGNFFFTDIEINCYCSNSCLPVYYFLRIFTCKKHPKIKLYSPYEKYEYGHLGRWYSKLTLFKRF